MVQAIKVLKNGKVLGLNNIAPEALKADVEVSADILYPSFRKV